MSENEIFNQTGLHKDSFSQMKDKQYFRNLKRPPHMHIYCSLVFVDPGDPEGKTKEDRRNKVWEAGQWCVPIEPKHVSNLKLFHLTESMRTLTHMVVNCVRRIGGLKAGE